MKTLSRLSAIVALIVVCLVGFPFHCLGALFEIIADAFTTGRSLTTARMENIVLRAIYGS